MAKQREGRRASQEERTTKNIQGTERNPAVAGTWEQGGQRYEMKSERYGDR